MSESEGDGRYDAWLRRNRRILAATWATGWRMQMAVA